MILPHIPACHEVALRDIFIKTTTVQVKKYDFSF